MEFALLEINIKLPIEIKRKLCEYEYTSRMFWMKMKLDAYIISLKFKVNREIETSPINLFISTREKKEQIYLDKQNRWTSILKKNIV